MKKIKQIFEEILKDYYPEMLAKIFVINAGRFIKTIYGFAGIWMNKDTKTKVSVLSGDGR